MTKEEKDLVLKDLSARQPYGVCVHIRYKEGEPCYGKLTPRDIQWFIDSKIEVIKPYLRPMSSMTKEEQQKYYDLTHQEDDDIWAKCLFDKMVDFCNEKHLDYRGLLEKGLALKAPKGMYNADAFIEKACEWFKNNWREYVNTDKDGVVCFGHWEKDFKKYMEGEQWL